MEAATAEVKRQSSFLLLPNIVNNPFVHVPAADEAIGGIPVKLAFTINISPISIATGVGKVMVNPMLVPKFKSDLVGVTALRVAAVADKS